MTPQKFYAIDKELIFRDVGQPALTADGYVGTQIDQKDDILTEYALVVNIESIDVANGDEAYTLRITGSNASDRSDARVLATIELGDAAAKAQDTADDEAGDQVVLRFASERPAGQNHRYLDCHLDVAGTSPSIAASIFLTKPQSM